VSLVIEAEAEGAEGEAEEEIGIYFFI